MKWFLFAAVLLIATRVYNRFLMQFQSDILGAEVIRPKVVEVTALGAAYLAGLMMGYWADIEDIRTNIAVDKVFKPKMTAERRAELVDGWNHAVRQARTR